MRKVIYEYLLEEEGNNERRLVELGQRWGMASRWVPLADSKARDGVLVLSVGATSVCWVCGRSRIPAKGRVVRVHLDKDANQQGRPLRPQPESFRIGLLASLRDRYPWADTFCGLLNKHCLIMLPNRTIYVWVGEVDSGECEH